jgi:hAT family C-terminal dimerisation region
MEEGSSALAYWQVSTLPIHLYTIINYKIQENRLRYPTVFPLAMDILPIQGSSVPCERIFSSAKQTLTDRRSRILPELMEALQMLKYSVKQGRSLNFTVGSSWDDERAAMQKLMEIHSDAPENLKPYQEFLVRPKVGITDNVAQL